MNKRIQNVQRALRAAKANRGLSMVELSIVLVIVSVLAAGAFLAFQSNSRRVETRDNIGVITQIASGLKANFGKQNQYATLTAAGGTTVAIQSRVIPTELRTSATTAINSYGGAIAVAVNATGLTQANDTAILTWPQVPSEQCPDLVVGTQNTARRIQVAGTVVKPTDGQLNLATLATQCESAANVAVLYDIGR